MSDDFIMIIHRSYLLSFSFNRHGLLADTKILFSWKAINQGKLDQSIVEHSLFEYNTLKSSKKILNID
jgi:hypothetical protein